MGSDCFTGWSKTNGLQTFGNTVAEQLYAVEEKLIVKQWRIIGLCGGCALRKH